MVIRGRVQNGVVILDQKAPVPDGTEVTVIVNSRETGSPACMTDAELKRYRDALSRLDALPNERPDDDFSGKHHDRALYGDGP